MPGRASVPRTSRYLISRPRVVDRMNDALDKRIFLLIAPAGYGKTTAAAEFVNQLKMLTAWVTLDPSMSEPTRLCWAIAESIREQRRGFGRRLTQFGSEGAQDPRSRASLFVEELRTLREPLIIVLDDFHVVDGQVAAAYSVADLMWALMTHPALGHLHIVLTSRTVPALRVSRLKLEGQLDGMDQDALVFTPEEVRAYLEMVNHRPVSLAEAEATRTGAGGWIAGIALTAGKANAEGPLRPEAIFQYLDEEVMPGLDPSLRRFAVEAAALVELSPTLCSYALERHDVDTRLHELEQNNLFLQRLPEHHGETNFRFHALFREYLLSCLDGDRARAIKARAGHYHLVHGDWLRGATYLEEAEAWPELIEALSSHGQTMMSSGQFLHLRDLLAKLRELQDLPDDLGVAYAETLVRSSEPELAEHILNGIKSASPEIGAQVAILRARTARIAGRNEEAIDIAEQELARKRCTVEQEALLHRVAGLASVFLGHLDDADRHHQLELERFQASGDAVQVAYSKSDLAICAVQRMDYARAERLFREAARSFRKLGRPDHLPMVLNNLATVLNVVGRQAEALELLEEAQGLVERSGDMYWRAEIHHTLGEIHRALGQLDSALSAFGESVRAAWDAGLTYCEQSASLWLAIVMAELGQASEAASRLAVVRQHPAASTQIVVLDDLATLRLAWLEEDFNACQHLAAKLIRRSEEFGQSRFVAFGKLFGLASAARQDPSSGRLDVAAVALLSNLESAVDAVTYFPDVFDAARAALPSERTHSFSSGAKRAWRRLEDVASERERSFRTSRAGAQSISAGLEVYALQPALRVLIDGQLHTGGWHSALDLFLYLVQHPRGGIGLDIASALWGDNMPNDRALQQRFQSRLAFLRRILGADAVIREGSARPGYYRLNPNIPVRYDVRQFMELAKAILSAPAEPEQLAALREARSLHADSYWPARSFGANWPSDIHHEIEATYYSLITRELQLAQARGLPAVDELDALRRDVTARTGIGLRDLLDGA